MNKNSKSRNGFIHLYNPKNEGLGLYDIHYINAHKEIKTIDHTRETINIKRQQHDSIHKKLA